MSRIGLRRSGSWRWPLIVCAALGLFAGVATATAPGWVRLAVMQPARDMLFFMREVQPLERRERIESAAPSPDLTTVLPAQGVPDHEPELALDVWIPDLVPAPAVLLLHGASPRGRKLGFNLMLADALRRAGWLVFTPDARGFGNSARPADVTDPAAWSVRHDLARLTRLASTHPNGNGVVTAVGHSMGAGHLLQLDEAAADIAALALIGPARYAVEPTADASAPVPIAWWDRVRFSADRRLSRAAPAQVVREESRRGDLMHAATHPPGFLTTVPVLLMDGEREGAELVAVLEEVARQLGPNARHVTVAGSHHYCGAYQLPWPFSTVYVRREMFDRCFDALEAFLEDSIARRR